MRAPPGAATLELPTFPRVSSGTLSTGVTVLTPRELLAAEAGSVLGCRAIQRPVLF